MVLTVIKGKVVQDKLERQVERVMFTDFGLQLTEIDRFIEGSNIDLMQLRADDDADHWLNLRPY